MKLLRVYPPAWRARYGDELVTLMHELDGDRLSWRTRLDVVRAGVRERGRALFALGLPPRDRAREGSLLVLYAWMVFLLGGFGVQKASEHWQAATPAADRGLPATAFDTLVAGAVIASLLVVAAVAATLPLLLSCFRGGAWRAVRRPILVALVLSVALVGATAGLAAWARSLTAAARNGHGGFYSGAFGAWVLLLAAVLLSWARAAAVSARALPFPARLLQLEARLALAVTSGMVVMTAASAVWWGSVASVAPAFFGASPVAVTMLVPTALMAGASLLAAVGSVGALRSSARA